jgi:hypothetical protein
LLASETVHHLHQQSTVHAQEKEKEKKRKYGILVYNYTKLSETSSANVFPYLFKGIAPAVAKELQITKDPYIIFCWSWLGISVFLWRAP